MKYRKLNKYKYQLVGQFSYHVGIREVVSTEYVLLKDGDIYIKQGYAWDGSSVVPDTKECMKASLVHDALCQLISTNKLQKRYREKADNLYRDMCVAGGMSPWRANLRLFGLKKFGKFYTSKEPIIYEI